GEVLHQGRHGHLTLPASATVGTRDSDAIPPPASPSRRRPPSLGPSGTGARAGRTPSRPPSHAPVLSRAPSLEVVRSCARWPTFHEIILAAMALRLLVGDGVQYHNATHEAKLTRMLDAQGTHADHA